MGGGLKWCIENVIAFYDPLIHPQELASHWFWANFHIKPIDTGSREHFGGIEALTQRKGFDISKYSGIEKIKTLRNCVEPELGLHILNESKRDIYPELFRKDNL